MSFQLIDGIPVWGQVQDNALEQMKMVGKTAYKTALMGDHHLGYSVPIGGVVAYQDAISPSGVGYDIGCGNKAVRLEGITGDELRAGIYRTMNEVFSKISFGVGRKNKESVDHLLFESDTWKLPMLSPLKRMAADQLGTVGSGNHYVDLFTDELDRVWVGVHFGSRGLGHKTATYFLKEAGATSNEMMVEPCVLKVGTALADDYIAAMHLAGDYAYAGRDWVCQRVADILRATIVEEVHNHHNYAWQEMHQGEMLWVVRKGATPAFPGQKGFVGATMTERAVIIEGKTPFLSDEGAFGTQYQQRLSLYSTIHGAGRVMGRRMATGVTKFDQATKTRTVVREPMVKQTDMDENVALAKIELRGAGVDESAFCYKRLPEVLAAHSATIDVLHYLTPVGVAMAGKGEYDPFRD